MLFTRPLEIEARSVLSREYREKVLREVTPVFVNSFNQYTYLSGMIDSLWSSGFKQIFVLDQASEYPLLLEYFSSESFKDKATLITLGCNIGPHEAIRFVRSLGIDTFVFTDPDIRLPNPIDPYFLSTLFDTSRRYKCKKVGLALDISEPHRFKDIRWRDSSGREFGIAQWERKFWRYRVDARSFRAPVDTTFFLFFDGVGFDYRRSIGGRLRYFLPARVFNFILEGWGPDIRIAGDGFVARHVPWYIDDPIPPEEVDFYQKAAVRWSSWVSNSS